MALVTNVKMGVCTISYNNIDLGHTMGGVEVTYEPVYQDITVDKYGKTTADKVLVGESFLAKIPLAEYTIANLRNAIPNATFAGAANTRVLLGQVSGQKLSTTAAALVIHPQAEQTKAFDVVFYKAIVATTVVLSHKVDGEKLIEVTFEALVDETKSAGNYLGLIGDSTT